MLYQLSYWPISAHDRIRTGDLFLTKEVLYQLSYMGTIGEGRIRTFEGASQQIYSLPRLTASVPLHIMSAHVLSKRAKGFEPSTLCLEGRCSSH